MLNNIIESDHVHRLRSSASPTCRLPREVLQQIFVVCAQTSFHMPKWSWVANLTFVCSAWRQAALDCGKLWSFIDFSHPRWTNLSLYRSKSLPVSVRAIINAMNQQLVFRTLHYAPKIRDIHIISSVYDIGPLMGALSNPNSSLESLTVNVLRPDNANSDLRYSKRFAFSLGAHLPSMLYLELHRTPIGLVSPRYTNLRDLSLHHLPFSERPSRHEFLSLLENFVMLERLTLVHAFPKNKATGDGTPGRIVHLPKLLTISLTGSILELVNILECVSMQPVGRIYCHVHKIDDFKTNFWRFAKAIGAKFHAAVDESPLDALVIEVQEESKRFTDENSYNLDFRQALHIQALGATTNTEPLLDLLIGPDPVHDEVVISALGSIWDALPLMNIHSLILQNLDVVAQKSWPRLLRCLPNLRIIEIIGHCPSGLIWALLMNARSHSHLEHDDTSSLLLPVLEDIYLFNTDCHAGGFMVSSSNVNSYCDLDDSRFLEVVSAYLEDRHRCGVPLRSLSISCCSNVTTDVLNEIKGHVPRLLWDYRGELREDPGQLETGRHAIYRSHWPSAPPPQRHYHRLRTLMDLD
ncbi:hypothetical protein C0993_004684 [Termitomyces sp. T159_Od127]|nr:hypothetical protein C0993_004684 [Termitomyces sp. T159_Od127]